MEEKKKGTYSGNRSKHNGSAGQHYFGPEVSPKQNRPVSSSPQLMGEAAGSSLPWLKELWNFARERMLGKGRFISSEDDLKFLEDHSEAIAEANAPLPWDPANNHYDKLREDECVEAKQDKAALVKKHDYEVAAAQEAERERANNCRRPRLPRISILMIILTIAFMGFSLTPSFSDGFFFMIADFRVRIIISALAGFLTAGSIVFLIIGEYRSTAKSVNQYVGLIGGLLICLGFGGVRLWASDFSAKGLLIAVVLFIIEAGVIIYLEYIANGLRREYKEYLFDKQERDRHDDIVNTAWAKAAMTEKMIEEKDIIIQNHHSYVQERISRHGQIATLKKLAKMTVRDGYAAGLAEIEGRYHSPWTWINLDKQK